jgi:DNA polymerase elongation subunit (family B)
LKRKFEHIFKSGYKTILRYQDNLNNSHFEEVNIPYELFVESKEETGYKYFLNKSINLKKLTFKNNKEFQEFEKNYGGLSNFKTYGKRNGMYSYIFENFFEKAEYSTPKILFLDIEVTSDAGFPYPEKAEFPISLFQFYDSFEKKYFCFYTSDANLDKEYIQSKFKEEVKFKKFSSEENMLLGFAKTIRILNPLIIAGWNIKGFDIPYIINRFKKLGMDPGNLSEFGTYKLTMKEYQGQTAFECDISGFVIVDMLDTYKKFVLVPRDSYSLNNIARVELGDSKVEYDEFENLTDLYYRDFTKFVEYGIKDVQLIVDIEAKKSIIAIQKTIADMMGITLDDALGTVRPWGMYVYNKALQRGLVLPNDSVNDSFGSIKGGWVMNPVPGKYRWVATIDWNSLYPNTIVSANLSPDVKVPLVELSKKYPDIQKIIRQYFSEDEEQVLSIPEDVLAYIKKICLAENISFSTLGIPFSNEKQGLLSELMENMYHKRKNEKKKSQNFKREYERLRKEIERRTT